MHIWLVRKKTTRITWLRETDYETKISLRRLGLFWFLFYFSLDKSFLGIFTRLRQFSVFVLSSVGRYYLIIFKNIYLRFSDFGETLRARRTRRPLLTPRILHSLRFCKGVALENVSLSPNARVLLHICTNHLIMLFCIETFSEQIVSTVIYRAIF